MVSVLSEFMAWDKERNKASTPNKFDHEKENQRRRNEILGADQKDKPKSTKKSALDKKLTLDEKRTSSKKTGTKATQTSTDDRLAQLKSELAQREASGDMGGTTLLRQEINRLNTQQKYNNASYDDNFTGQFQASFAQGRLSQDEAKAWNDYLSAPTAANRKKAEQASAVLKQFQERNKETLKDDATLPWLSQSAAGYLPQLVDQTKASVAGGLIGAGAGSVVPVVGTAAGMKAGMAAGSGVYSFSTMRGSAFKSLLELGVDEETARKAATDEAIIASLIEMADTGIDVATLGIGGLINTVSKGGVKALAKKGAKEGAEQAWKKFAKGLAKYGLNVGGEMAEEASQQAVSIANQRRAQGGITGTADLVGRSLKTGAAALTGKDPEAAREMWAAAKEGGKIAAMMFPAGVAGRVATEKGLGITAGNARKAGAQAAQKASAAETGKDTPAAGNATQVRGLGRVTADYEQFRKEYAKRAPEATEEQIREQFELVKGYASGQDVVETAQGPMTRAEIKERLAGLQDEKEIDRVVDGLLDEQERRSAVQEDGDLPWTWGEDSTQGEPRQTAEEGPANEETAPYTESEVTTNGSEEVYLRDGGQRPGGAYPGRPVSRLEESAGRSEGREAESKPADREAAALTYGEEVSTGSLGIPGGSTAKTVRRVTGGETAAVQEARKIAGERGLELVLFGGNNLDVRVKGGQMASARAYIIGKKVFVRADHPVYTADQLMRHETGHDLIAKGEVDPNQVRQRIWDTHGAEQLDELSRQYAEAYEGSGMSAGEIWEEIICDSLGDMNIFASVEMATEVTGQIELTEQADTANPETEQSRGPPAEGKASIETLENGKKYVRADRQVIFGNDPDAWSEQLEDYINGKIRNGQDIRLVAEDGDVLTLTADTAGKVASFYENGRTMSDEAFERKVNAGAHIDELAQVSTRGYDRPKADYNARHGRMASVGWDYRTAFFQDFNGKYYQCTISVSMGEDGNVVYNIGKIKERRFPHALNALSGSSAESGALRGETSSTQTVAQDGGEVNGKSSREPTKRKTSKVPKAMVKEIQSGVRKEVAEQRRVTELKHKIRRHSEQMSGELLRPTDKRHIPEELRGPVALLLEAVNLESGYDLEYGRDAKYHRVERGTPGAEKTKRTQAFLDLKTAYGKLKEELVLDPDLLGSGGNGLLDEAMALGEKPVDAMNSQELTTIWKTVRAVEASVRTANQMFAKAKFATIQEAAEAVRKDNGWKNPRTELNYIGGLQRLTGLDMMTPETFFHQMGDSGEALFRMMRDAQDEHVRIMKAVADFTHKTLDKVDVPALEKKLHTVTLGGEKVTLSTAQIMELHVLMRREQAHEHILAGGILPKSLPGRGLKKISRPEPVRGITVDELTAAIGVLSEEEAALAEKLQRYASNQLSDYGNRASMEVYNYRKFEEKNYWPIRSNRQEIRSTTEQDTQVTGVANRGFTKTTKPDANTSVVVGSIFDTFANHAAEMATYSAWLGATEDINRIRNYVFRDGEGNRTGTVKGLINRVHGERGADYLQKLLADVANGVKGAHGESDYMGALIGNYKAASVGANLRVIIQQPTALLRALDMIGARHFVGTGNPLTGWEKAKKYAPIAQWKDWGYFDINTGRQMKDVLFDSDSKLDQLKNAAMAPAGAMDSLSWGLLWNAVENETRAKHKDLQPGTEEFYQAVAERFTRIVDHTQVVDGILQRSQIMRSANGLTKMATSFMGEPTKQYNMMMAAVYDLSHADGKTKEEAKKRLARTAFALCVSAVVNAAAQASVDAVRDDDKEKDYWEKWLEAFTGIKGDEESTGEKIRNAVLEGNLGNSFNPAGYIPYLKDALSLIQGYDVSRMDMESIEKTVTASQNMMKALGGEGKYSIAGAGANLTAEVARLFGIPAANLKREVESFASLFAVETDNYLMQYRMEKAMLNPTYSGNAKTFYDILYHASKDDQEAHEIIYSDMLKLGYDEKRIKNAMETRMKAEQNVDSVDELSSRYLSPEQIAEYADLGISVDTYAMAYEATRDLEAIKDEEGDAVPNSLGLQIMAAVYSIPGLTAEQYKKLAGDLGAGKTVLGYSEKMVKSKLAAMEKNYGK